MIFMPVGYLDPSVMTYAIQAIAGILIASGAVFGLYFRRFAKRFSGVLPDKKKKKESDRIVWFRPGEEEGVLLSDIDKEGAACLTRNEAGIDENGFLLTDPRTQEGGEKSRARRFFSELTPGIILAFAASALIYLYAPTEIFLANQGEFWFDLPTMLGGTVKLFLALFAVLVIALALARLIGKKLYHVLLVAGFIVFFCTYVQGNYLAGVMPPMDGSAIDWSLYRPQMITSVILWLVVTAVCLVLVRLLRMTGMKKLIAAVSMIIIAVLAVSVGVLHSRYGGFERKIDAVVTTDGELTMSEDENLVILVLDAVDAARFRELMEENPAWQDTFEDFTFFPNTMGAYSFTDRAIPQILTGVWFENKEDYSDYTARALEEAPLLGELAEREYRAGFYEPVQMFPNEQLLQFENVVAGEGRIGSFPSFAWEMTSLVGFKYAPYPLKRFAELDTEDFEISHAINTDKEAFSFSNLPFYQGLAEKEIELSEEPCFRFIHIEGAHTPFNYNRNVEIIDTAEGTYNEKLMCSVTIADAYLKKLKEAGVYDNTAIIIMADHGYNDGVLDEPVMGRQNPLLLIKGRGETHAFAVNEAPLSYDDLQTAYARLLDGKKSTEAFDWHEGDARTRRYLLFRYLEEDHMEEYEQTGYVTDEETMLPTGRNFDRTD